MLKSQINGNWNTFSAFSIAKEAVACHPYLVDEYNNVAPNPERNSGGSAVKQSVKKDSKSSEDDLFSEEEEGKYKNPIFL